MKDRIQQVILLSEGVYVKNDWKALGNTLNLKNSMIYL